MIGSSIVWGIDIGCVGMEGFGIISGNCTGIVEVFVCICSCLLFIDDEIVIERVIVGGLKRLTVRCDN